MWDRPDWIEATLALPRAQAAVLASDAVPAGLPVLAEPMVEVIACPHPFSMERIYLSMPEGLTLAEILRLAGVPEEADARVFILSGALLYGPIAKDQWDRLRPQPGRRVVVRAIPRGGGGADRNKALRTVLQLVVMIVAFALSQWLGSVLADVPGGSAIAGATGLAVNVLGQMAVAALLAPPLQHQLGTLSGTGGPAATRSKMAYAITGSQNKASPYGPIPVIFGTARTFPPP